MSDDAAIEPPMPRSVSLLFVRLLTCHPETCHEIDKRRRHARTYAEREYFRGGLDPSSSQLVPEASTAEEHSEYSGAVNDSGSVDGMFSTLHTA